MCEESSIRNLLMEVKVVPTVYRGLVPYKSTKIRNLKFNLKFEITGTRTVKIEFFEMKKSCTFIRSNEKLL
jgi:hypothetical protein